MPLIATKPAEMLQEKTVPLMSLGEASGKIAIPA